jgi:hypothetical protein
MHHHHPILTLTSAAALASLLAACAATPVAPMAGGTMPPSQAPLPAAVQVPAGHRVALETVGTGEIIYECREGVPAMGQHGWVFVGPSAELKDRQGRSVGRYFGPPATWQASDGSAITGTQLAVAAAGVGDIPLQLVQARPAAPAAGSGTLSGISHVQRLATRGGVAPMRACNEQARGQRQTVPYQADYVFWKPAP